MLAGKFGAGFTSGTGLNGNQGFTLQYLSIFSSQHGMLWHGLDTHFLHTLENTDGVNRLGCQLGVMAQDLGNSEMDSRDLA